MKPAMDSLPIDALVETLNAHESVMFAYIYGSVLREASANDIDIAVFLADDADPHHVSADLKISLAIATHLPPDGFDVRILNGVENSDLFGLLYLKRVLDEGRILVDKDRAARAAFLERYGLRYRECAGLIQEVLA